ncbi:MAG: thiamine phosphate synthase [Ruminococcus sp.]
MSEIVCVTQSTLCGDNFLNQIGKICRGGIDRIILREKHLSESEYFRLAYEVKNICLKYNTDLTVHKFYDTALKLNIESFHCSYMDFTENRYNLKNTGVSVHSVSEAVKSENLGAEYITAGHVFETQCKAGLAPRGTDFIREICQNVKIPVYAIGGINSGNVKLLKNTGISGICVMSSLMKSENPEILIENLRANLK